MVKSRPEKRDQDDSMLARAVLCRGGRRGSAIDGQLDECFATRLGWATRTCAANGS